MRLRLERPSVIQPSCSDNNSKCASEQPPWDCGAYAAWLPNWRGPEKPTAKARREMKRRERCVNAALLCPRMKFPMHFPQPVARDMGVDLRRADAGVAEQFLDHPQICPVFQ